MAVAKMKLAKITGPLGALNKFISSCCTDGNFHPEQANEYLSASMGYTSLNEENPYADMLAKIEELATETSNDVKLTMVSKTRLKASDEKAVAFIKELNETFSQIRSKREALEKEIAVCKTEITRFDHFTGLDIDLKELFGCEFIDVRFGHLPKENYDRFIAYNDNPYLLFVNCSQDATDYWGVYCAPHNRIKVVDRIFAGLHFDRLEMPSADGTPEEIVESLKSRIEIASKQLIELDDETIEQWKKTAPRCNEIYTQLVLLNSVFELRRYAASNGSDFFYVGWIPVEYEKTLEENVKAVKGIYLELSNPDADDAPPIKLKNPKIFRPYEYFVNMYGLPSYSDLDVTAFMAISYTLLFGIMFADVGQGLVLFILGILGWRLKKIELCRIITMCGAASTVFGFVFGSVFGYEEMLDPLYHSLGMAGKPLSVMDSINTVLLLAIGIGVALVVAAMLLNIVGCIKRRHFGEAVFSENGLVGILFYLSAVTFAVAFMGGKKILPNSVLFAVMGICAVFLYLKQLFISVIDKRPELKPESIGDFLMQNIFEVIEYVLSYFSNTVSFLRVGAFVIVHASMMMVVFTLGGDGKNIPVIIIGNIVVIALEGLLTGIQGLRLEFYEMFSRFYEGSGRPFTSVKIEFPKKTVKAFSSKARNK